MEVEPRRPGRRERKPVGKRGSPSIQRMVDMDAFRELRERVYEANMELPRKGLVIGTFGNVSGLDRGRGVFAIKPSGVPYDELKPGMMVVVGLDGRVVDGALNPSSDTETHAVIYRGLPEVGGIAHTHSTYATAWAQARRPIPCFGTTQADCVPGRVPCTRAMTGKEIGGDYEAETGKVIIECLEEYSPGEMEMVLVASHGPFTLGDTPERAVSNSVLLEELAKTAFLTVLLNPSCGEIDRALLERHFRRKHGRDAYYGQG